MSINGAFIPRLASYRVIVDGRVLVDAAEFPSLERDVKTLIDIRAQQLAPN